MQAYLAAPMPSAAAVGVMASQEHLEAFSQHFPGAIPSHQTASRNLDVTLVIWRCCDCGGLGISMGDDCTEAVQATPNRCAFVET